MPTPKWLIEGLFEVNSLVMLAGPPASYKSFLVLDWALSMASGRDWHGKPTAPARVLYVLGEGKSSLLKRMQAWIHYHQIDRTGIAKIEDNFKVAFDVPQMASKASVDNLLAGLEAEGYSPNVIVIDTFARSFVGLDENSQKDTGVWVESADRLRQLGYTVIFLHHTAKNTEFGMKYRGSTAIMGAMDTAFTLQKDGSSPNRSILSCTKQKDHDEGPAIYFQRLIVCPDPSDEGSIVLVPAIALDNRFTEDGKKSEDILETLIKDDSFESDRARGRKLAQLAGISEFAGIKRVQNRRKEQGESRLTSDSRSTHPELIDSMEFSSK